MIAIHMFSRGENAFQTLNPRCPGLPPSGRGKKLSDCPGHMSVRYFIRNLGILALLGNGVFSSSGFLAFELAPLIERAFDRVARSQGKAGIDTVSR